MIVWRNAGTVMGRLGEPERTGPIVLATLAGMAAVFGFATYARSEDFGKLFFTLAGVQLALSFAWKRRSARARFPILRRQGDLICIRKRVLADALSAVLRVRSFSGGFSTQLCSPDGKYFVVRSFRLQKDAVALAVTLASWLDIPYEEKRKSQTQVIDMPQEETIWPPAPHRPEGRPDASPALPEWMEDADDPPPAGR